MRRMYVCMCATLSLLTAASVARADEAAARAIIDKAIEARGGEAKLTKFTAAKTSSKGTIYRMGLELAYTSEESTQYPDKTRAVIDLDVMGQSFQLHMGMNGDEAWMQFGDMDTMDLEGDQLVSAMEEMYADWITSLVPLKDKAFKLSSLGDSEVNGKAVVGVKVSRAGKRDISMYFDKESHLLVKSERRSLDAEAGGEVDSETFFSNYKEADGIKYPSKLVSKRDGETSGESEITQYKPLEKLDAETFERP